MASRKHTDSPESIRRKPNPDHLSPPPFGPGIGDASKRLRWEELQGRTKKDPSNRRALLEQVDLSRFPRLWPHELLLKHARELGYDEKGAARFVAECVHWFLKLTGESRHGDLEINGALGWLRRRHVEASPKDRRVALRDYEHALRGFIAPSWATSGRPRKADGLVPLLEEARVLCRSLRAARRRVPRSRSLDRDWARLTLEIMHETDLSKDGAKRWTSQVHRGAIQETVLAILGERPSVTPAILKRLKRRLKSKPPSR